MRVLFRILSLIGFCLAALGVVIGQSKIITIGLKPDATVLELLAMIAVCIFNMGLVASLNKPEKKG